MFGFFAIINNFTVDFSLLFSYLLLKILYREIERRPELKSPGHKTGMVLDQGWSSAAFRSRDIKRNSLENDEHDPIMEQIIYVKEMIAQAERANRKAEISSLTANLAELKSEYNRQRVAKAFSSSSETSRNNSPFKNKNPFLQDEQVRFHNTGNPFLSPENDSSHPFVEENNQSSNSNPFLDESNFSDDSNPLLQQICYVSKCLDEAVKQGKNDEAVILRQNLIELQSMHSQ